MMKVNLFCIFSLVFLLSCNQPIGTVTDTPTIVAGTSTITGKISRLNETNKDSVLVVISVLHPISGENVRYKAYADQSGEFSIDVDVETTVSLVGLYTSVNLYKSLLVKLMNGGVTHIDIVYNPDNTINNIDVTPDMDLNDMTEGLEIVGKMIDYRSGRTPKPLYDKSTDYFLEYAKTILSERLAIIDNDTLLSKGLKEILSNDFRLFLYKAFVFDYEDYMLHNYKATNADQSKKPDIQKIDKSYYHFLNDFNLNDPRYLLCFTFPEVQLKILQNEILRLPVIGESDIPSWLVKAKAILSDLVGFDDGPYYDILAANAYGRQLNEEVKPLTEKQKENIANYWEKGEISKILFRKNQQVVELDKFKSPVVVNDISSVPDDKVIETIVAKHQDKVVFIDLWATWCAPCLEAMKQFRSTKNDFRDKDVAFVYLTNGSSPRKLWEEKIKGIGSEHYYLESSQWDYIMNHFGFEAIPSYLLYNKEGVLIDKFTVFPGSDEVKDRLKKTIGSCKTKRD